MINNREGQGELSLSLFLSISLEKESSRYREKYGGENLAKLERG